LSHRLNRTISEPQGRTSGDGAHELRTPLNAIVGWAQILSTTTTDTMAEHGGVTLAVALPEDTCVIMGDRARLQQVVWNLLSNAVKFAPYGHVQIAVRHRGDLLRAVPVRHERPAM